MMTCMCVIFSEVSCKTLEGMDGLKKLIYQMALSMKDNSSTAFGSKLLGRLVSINPQLVSLWGKHWHPRTARNFWLVVHWQNAVQCSATLHWAPSLRHKGSFWVLNFFFWSDGTLKNFLAVVALCQIPRSYLTLQEAVMAEKRRRDAEGEVQYLTEAQLDSIVEQNPASDIRDYEDLQTGTKHSF